MIFVPLIYTLTQTLLQTMTIWIYLVIICPVRIILQEIDQEESAFKESLSTGMFKINYFQECICFDLKLGSRLCTTVPLSRWSSQSIHEIENFLNKFNLTVESITQTNPFLTVVIGDFNARSSEWLANDKTTQEGLKIENLLS